MDQSSNDVLFDEIRRMLEGKTNVETIMAFVKHAVYKAHIEGFSEGLVFGLGRSHEAKISESWNGDYFH